MSLYRGMVHLLREAVTRRKTAVQLDPGLIVEFRKDVHTNYVERDFVKHRRTLLDEAEGWIEGSRLEHFAEGNAVWLIKKMWPLPPSIFIYVQVHPGALRSSSTSSRWVQVR